MAEFFDILPPPQSIDDLDAWGALDALPASLDDGFWTRVGVYGLSASENARAGQAFSVLRKRCVGLSAGAASRQTLGFLRVRVDALKADARASGSVKMERERPLVVRGAAEGSSLFTLFRVKPVVPEEAKACSAGGMAIMRLVGLACAGGAFGGGSALLVRVIDLSGRGSALGVGSVFPEYKGWMWARRDDVPEGTWNQAHAGRADWRPRTVAGADWQGVVEWQQAE